MRFKPPNALTQSRRTVLRGAGLLTLAAALAPERALAIGRYAWAEGLDGAGALEAVIAPPSGFVRTPAAPGSFAAWLRGLPMKPAGSPVLLHTGAEKARQDVHAAVVDIDTGKRDLQQCADAVMRLRAEWLFSSGQLDEIAFTMTEGGRVPFSRWAKGERPDPAGKKWKKSAGADAGYANFRKYLDFVFAYAGTASLEKELSPADAPDVAIGNVFIKGGFPGHAVLVADLTENVTTKAKRFLLLQSYMPAQEIHVLKNPANGDGSPWYAPPSSELVTPEWRFPPATMKRWPVLEEAN